jgi:pimeloyl-ACP methyl ester carboxylesterase
MENNKIDKKEKIKIGGIEQWIFLRSTDISNPIILFLHGGPGTAQISFSRKLQSKLINDFFLVNWDQRGAGRSYKKTLKEEEMNIERFILDTEELIEILIQRFKQKKIFLIGHSWGSIIGAYLSARRPDLIWAYVGIGQVVNMKRGEKLSFKDTIEEAYRRDNKKAIRELQRIGEPPYKKLAYSGIQRKWLSRFNGITFKSNIYKYIFKNISLKDLRPLDIVRFIKGSIFSLKCLEEEQMEINLLKELPEIKVPVYFCTGRRDYNVPFELVKEYMEILKSPHKEIVWFENSGHLPNFEEPEKFNDFCLLKLKKHTKN